MRGWVELRGLRCLGQHGAYPEERAASPRPFVVDVAVQTDVAAAAESDDLGDALDLAALAETVRQVVNGEPRALLEALALDAAGRVLRRFPAAEQVRVRVAKPDPPGLDAAEEAVSLEVSRAMLGG